ncbi:hypothetical protein TPDSL_16190 [Terrisporobacter petrolearius]|uniref:hypothetical protein n=1 Tax=Terrisporobacter petrolearius TaxID=1460447 RepID=UPI003365BCEA
MKRIIDTLENTINKSTTIELRAFLEQHKDIRKWMIISDYCFYDNHRNNNCISFILYPYIIDLATIQDEIKQRAKVDLKHTRSINDSFCEMYKLGIFYSINFIVDDDNFFSKEHNVDIYQKMICTYKALLEKWITNQPHKKENYENIIKKFNKFLNETKRKNFNLKLFKEIFWVDILVSYITYLIIKELDVELIGWFSDPDKIISSYDGIAFDLYEIIYHTLCVEQLGENYKQPKIAYTKIEKDIFYDELVRMADYICGFVSEFDLNSKTKGYKEKYVKIAEDIVADNKYISIIKIDNNGISKVVHSRIK